jgi:hypothetical protein
MANPCYVVNSNPDSATPDSQTGYRRNGPGTHLRCVQRGSQVCPTPHQKGCDLSETRESRRTGPKRGPCQSELRQSLR